MNDPSRHVSAVIHGSDVANGNEMGNTVETGLPINIMIKWGRRFQIICFNQ